MTAVSDTGKALPDDIKAGCTCLDHMCFQHLHVCLQGRIRHVAQLSTKLIHQTLLDIDMMQQVLKTVFAGLFTAGVNGICDQQVLAKTTGEQH